MDIPTRIRDSAGEVVLTVVVVFFVLLAIVELILAAYVPIQALVPAGLWLAFVFFGVRSSIRSEGGIRQFLIRRVGVFACRHFAEIAPGDGQKVLSFGYDWFGRRLYYIRIMAGAVRSVKWGAGQASSLSGRDMNDWHVIVWFEREQATTLDWNHVSRPKYGLHIVGPSQEKRKAEALGKNLAEFLHKRGLGGVESGESNND
jgi:hypothetical protein